MNATLTSPAVTPEELYALGEEGYGFELIDGHLREREMSRESTRSASRLLTRFQNYYDTNDQGWVFGMDLGYRCFAEDPGRVRFADVSIIFITTLPLDEYEDEGYCTTVPDLVVESVSPNDNAYELETKIHQWLDAGVKVVLKLLPNVKSIQIYRNDGSLKQLVAADVFTLDDLLPGLCVPVADLFRKPGENAAAGAQS